MSRRTPDMLSDATSGHMSIPVPRDEGLSLSQSMATLSLPQFITAQNNALFGDLTTHYRINQIATKNKESDTVLFCDGERYHVTVWDWDDPRTTWGIQWCHRNSANFIFADGHAEGRTLSEINDYSFRP